MQKILLTLSIILYTGTLMTAQNTVGLLSYEPSQAYDGYNILYPHNQPFVYLLDNCGEIVHVWEDEVNFRPGNTAYILPNGNLVKTKRDMNVVQDPIWAGGGGAFIEIRSWDNDLIWSYELNDENGRLHHDIAPMPNGNILAIAWENKSEAEAIQAGRDPDNITEGEIWPDYIIELDPLNDTIVWEWHAWDHLIQDFDPTKDNFGDVGANPGKIDINYDNADGTADWMHSNSIDYNFAFDLIVISVPEFHEFWIIDHSTTTAEAAGSTGGLYGKGGELLYRWGNPAAYRQGTEEDQQCFYQHDVHWVDDFIDFTNPYFQQIAFFNNRVTSNISQVNVVNPPFDMYNGGFTIDNGVFGPDDYELTIQHPEDPTLLHSTGLSSTQFLPNGNVLITAGRTGYTVELTPDNEIAWEYVTPIAGGASATQGDSLTINQNLTFRMYRYPADYTAFDGKDLSSKGWIELNPDTTFCELILPTDEVMKEYGLNVFPNPVRNTLTIEWEGGLYADIVIYDVMGRTMMSTRASGGRKYCDVSQLQSGVYFVEIEGREVRRFVKQ